MDAERIERLRRELVRTSQHLHARGWVANHDGNLSARLDGPDEDGPRLLCSPTALSKADVALENLLVVDGQGRVLEGARKPFSELSLHLAAYQARPDIGVVLHAHPPHLTGFAVAGLPLPHPFLAEAVVSLGPTIPSVPHAPPGDERLARGVAEALAVADVVVLEQHGLLTVGGSFEQALLRMELVEHLARIALAAGQLGGVRPLDPELVRSLAARGRPPSQPLRAPPTAAEPVLGPSPALTGARPDVRAEIALALERFRRG